MKASSLTISALSAFIAFLIFGCLAPMQTVAQSHPPQARVTRGGPPMSMHEYRQGDVWIGVMYINDDGLGGGDTIYPRVMRISAASEKEILYQIIFFQVGQNQQIPRDFPVRKSSTTTVGKLSNCKAVLLSGTKEATHRTVIEGTLEIDGQFQAFFTGSIVFADESAKAEFAKWDFPIDNVFHTSQKERTLIQGSSLSITKNVVE